MCHLKDEPTVLLRKRDNRLLSLLLISASEYKQKKQNKPPNTVRIPHVSLLGRDLTV
jgi:hypothetical protein